MSTFDLHLRLQPQPSCDRAVRLGMWLRCTLDRARMHRDHRRRSRELAGLCNHILRDIGITRADALKASTRPFER